MCSRRPLQPLVAPLCHRVTTKHGSSVCHLDASSDARPVGCSQPSHSTASQIRLSHVGRSRPGQGQPLPHPVPHVQPSFQTKATKPENWPGGSVNPPHTGAQQLSLFPSLPSSLPLHPLLFEPRLCSVCQPLASPGDSGNLVKYTEAPTLSLVATFPLPDTSFPLPCPPPITLAMVYSFSAPDLHSIEVYEIVPMLTICDLFIFQTFISFTIL